VHRFAYEEPGVPQQPVPGGQQPPIGVRSFARYIIRVFWLPQSVHATDAGAPESRCSTIVSKLVSHPWQ